MLRAVLLLLLVSCKPHKRHNGLSTTANTQSKDSTQKIFEGLVAEPGSPSRRNAGAILEAKITTALSSMPQPSDPSDRSQLEATKKIFRSTIEYLKAPSVCPANKKVRVYRGFGASPRFGRPGITPKFFMADAFTNSLRSALATRQSQGAVPKTQLHFKGTDSNGVPQLDGMLEGEIAFTHLDKLDWTFDALNLPFFFGKERASATNRAMINGMWSKLADDHSTSSENSPLISVSVAPSVSAIWGPGYFVLDFCPERLFISHKGGVPFEEEFLVPLFILPEEIVEAAGYQCPLHEQVKNSSYCGKQMLNMIQMERPTPNQTTEIYQTCFFATQTHELVEKRFDAMQKTFNSELAKAPAFLTSIQAENITKQACPPLNCEDAKILYDYVVAKNRTSDFKQFVKNAKAKCPQVR